MSIFEQQKGRKRNNKAKNHNVLSGYLMLFAFALIICGVSATGFAVTRSSRIYPNIFVGEICVENLSPQDAEVVLKERGWDDFASRKLHVTMLDSVYEDITYVESGLVLDTASAVKTAYSYGRESNILSGLFHYVLCLMKPIDVNNLHSKIDYEYVRQKTADCAAKVNSILGHDSYFIDRENSELVITKGQGTIQLNVHKLESRILEALQYGKDQLIYNELEGEASQPDFQYLFDSVYAEMKDASFSTDGSHKIIRECTGYRFDIDEAIQLWNQAKIAEPVHIPLEITNPSITAEQLESNLYHDLLGATTTKYNNSGENRCSNVRLATSLIDGEILFPGEEFSYNQVVGVRTEEAGFLPAPAYAGYDDIKDEIGGGVCQVSTTLYASTLFAFLEVTSHTSHLYPPNYIQLGMDATVTIPAGGGRSIDFKFKNNKNYPVKIVGYCEETERNGRPFKTVTVEIWGTLEDDDFMPIEFDNSYSNIYDYDRVIEPAYQDRDGVKIKFTHEENEFEDETGKGLRTLTHRKVFDSAGNLIQDRIINQTYSAGYALDTYYYHG